MLGGFVQYIFIGAKGSIQRHYQPLPDRIDGRVAHLCKKLLEVVREVLALVRQCSQGHVGSHTAYRFFAGFHHRRQYYPEIFRSKAMRYLPLQQVFLIVFFIGRCGRVGQVFQVYLIRREPLAVGLAVADVLFKLLVADDASFFKVYHEHLSWL